MTKNSLYIILCIFLSSCISQKSITKKNNINSVIGEARTYIGTPYKWGGNDKLGIDCSGLLVRSFESIGMKIPRTTGQQIELGKKVSLKKTKKGDLVFFAFENGKNGEIFVRKSPATSIGILIKSLEKILGKKKKIKVKERYLNYAVVVTDDNKTQIKKRDGSGIWKNLYEFPLIETETETSAKHISKELDLNFTNLLSVKRINHKLSHQLLHITFFVFKADNIIDDLVDINSLINYPFPRPLNKFISELV